MRYVEGDSWIGSGKTCNYASFSQWPFSFPILAVWTSSKPAQLRRSISALVRSIDRDLPVADVLTLEEIISGQLAFGRFEAIIYSSFAGLALLLAAVGIYGIPARRAARVQPMVALRNE